VKYVPAPSVLLDSRCRWEGPLPCVRWYTVSLVFRAWGHLVLDTVVRHWIVIETSPVDEQSCMLRLERHFEKKEEEKKERNGRRLEQDSIQWRFDDVSTSWQKLSTKLDNTIQSELLYTPGRNKPFSFK
jgi:hypothetical protein